LRFWIFILLFFASLSTYSQDNGLKKQSIINDYKAKLIKYMQDDTVASLSYCILIDGKIVFSEAIGYADCQNKIKADTNTIYRIGSITKPITAFLMMQMIEKGYFKLDDKIEDYLPEVKNLIGYSDSTRITFRQLARHRSGLPINPGLDGAASGPIEQWEDKVIAAIPTTSFIFKPDEKFSYSNFGFGILGLAISRAVGKPFMELVQENIFSPLKMNSTFFIMPNDKWSRLATGTMKQGYEQYKDVPVIEQKGRGYKVPVGGVYSTPNDYAKFIQALMGKSEVKILSDENCKLIKTIGIGVRVADFQNDFVLIGVEGSNVGYTTAFAFDRKYNNGVILMRNYYPEYGYREYTKDFLEQLNIDKKKLNTTSATRQAGFRCFVERKLVFWKAVLRRKFIGKLPACV
jgi:CubicO group peptidase (beta-lactamase class C family)